MKPLPRWFYLRPTLHVARELLGKYIVRRLRNRTLVGKIVEVEAYRGVIDPASHAYRGLTQRNKVMFEEGGHLYVYFTYGMHFCANVVTGKNGIGEAVLIRAVEPKEGVEIMWRNRLHSRAKSSRRGKKTNDGRHRKYGVHLTNGPAKFCEAFGIGQKDNGTDLIGKRIFIANGKKIAKAHIGRSTRVGIRVGTERRWRFYVKGNPWVSK